MRVLLVDNMSKLRILELFVICSALSVSKKSYLSAFPFILKVAQLIHATLDVCNLHTAIFAHKPMELKEYTTIFKLPSVKKRVLFNASISRRHFSKQYF